MFSKILLPIDLAEPAMSAHAVDVAQHMAQAFDSKLRLINVQSLVPLTYIDYLREDFDAEIRRGLEKELDQYAATIRLPAARVSTKLLFGPVHQQTLAEADEWKADVIVVGSHNPGLERFLIGSQASAIVARSRCSVFVLRGLDSRGETR